MEEKISSTNADQKSKLERVNFKKFKRYFEEKLGSIDEIATIGIKRRTRSRVRKDVAAKKRPKEKDINDLKKMLNKINVNQSVKNSYSAQISVLESETRGYKRKLNDLANQLEHAKSEYEALKKNFDPKNPVYNFSHKFLRLNSYLMKDVKDHLAIHPVQPIEFDVSKIDSILKVYLWYESALKTLKPYLNKQGILNLKNLGPELFHLKRSTIITLYQNIPSVLKYRLQHEKIVVPAVGCEEKPYIIYKTEELVVANAIIQYLEDENHHKDKLFALLRIGKNEEQLEIPNILGDTFADDLSREINDARLLLKEQELENCQAVLQLSKIGTDLSLILQECNNLPSGQDIVEVFRRLCSKVEELVKVGYRLEEIHCLEGQNILTVGRSALPNTFGIFNKLVENYLEMLRKPTNKKIGSYIHSWKNGILRRWIKVKINSEEILCLVSKYSASSDVHSLTLAGEFEALRLSLFPGGFCKKDGNFGATFLAADYTFSKTKNFFSDLYGDLPTRSQEFYTSHGIITDQTLLRSNIYVYLVGEVFEAKIDDFFPAKQRYKLVYPVPNGQEHHELVKLYKDGHGLGAGNNIFAYRIREEISTEQSVPALMDYYGRDDPDEIFVVQDEDENQYFPDNEVENLNDYNKRGPKLRRKGLISAAEDRIRLFSKSQKRLRLLVFRLNKR